MSDVYLSIISDNAKVEIKAEELKNDQSLFEDLQFDSVSFVGMIVELEGSYRITFDEEYIDPEKLQTLGDVAKYIKQKLKDAKLVGRDIFAVAVAHIPQQITAIFFTLRLAIAIFIKGCTRSSFILIGNLKNGMKIFFASAWKKRTNLFIQ